MGNLSPLLAARDMKKTIEFYQNILGFELTMVFPAAENPQYVDLSKDGMVLMFVPAEDFKVSEQDKLGIGVNTYMQIDGDIDQYYLELKNKGATIVEDIKDEPFGIRDFTIEDINGYKITFSNPTGKKCMSCGMPMVKTEDFGGSDPNNLHCLYCTNPDGSLKTYDEILEGMASFLVATQNIDRETAQAKAKEQMSNMPTWSSI
jgi:uncharacterized glyoxalase superfamily protein PhnB